MSEGTFVSYALNHEDVVIWRVLGGWPAGRYLDVHAGRHERDDAVRLGRGIEERGWHRDDCDLRRDAPPTAPGSWGVVCVDDSAVRHATFDPAVAGETPLVVVRAWTVPPDSPAVTDLGARLARAGYVHVLYDGVSHYHVHRNHHAELAGLLAYPACARDGYVDERLRSLAEQRGELERDVVRWRGRALAGWESTVPQRELERALTGMSLSMQENHVHRLEGMQAQIDLREDALRVKTDEANGAHAAIKILQARVAVLENELRELRDTLSWRVTKPLRAARTRAARRRA